MKKQILLFILTLMSVSVKAEIATYIDGIFYVFRYDSNRNTDYAMVTNLSTSSSDYKTYENVVIPPEVVYEDKTYPVMAIDSYTFQGCKKLKSITIPNSIITIGSSAFKDCEALKSVHISDIESWCKIDIQSNKANPLYYAHHLYLDNTEITDLVVPNGVTKINNRVFYGCSAFTSVCLSESVTSIGSSAFKNCSNLTSINLYPNLTSIDSDAFDGCNIQNVKTTVSDLSTFCNNEVLKLIKDKLNKPIVLIDEDRKEIKEYVIPNGVTSIGNSAFVYCTGLTSVTIPNTVTSIGEEAFMYCTRLASITIPKNISSIGNSAFSGCNSLSSVTIHSETIGSWFRGLSSINEVTIGDEVTSIGNDAFSNCTGITSLEIPSNVVSLGSSAFKGCKNLLSISISNSITSIGYSSFEGCSNLSSLTIPNSVTSIGSSAFKNCSSLTSINLYSSINSIDSYAFEGCNINDVKVTVTDFSSFCNNEVIKQVRHSINKPVTLIDNEGQEIRDYNIPNGVTIIGNSTFENCTGLTSVSIPNSVTSIGDEAFAECSGLTSITIPNNVTSIGNKTFRNCI